MLAYPRKSDRRTSIGTGDRVYDFAPTVLVRESDIPAIATYLIRAGG